MYQFCQFPLGFATTTAGVVDGVAWVGREFGC